MKKLLLIPAFAVALSGCATTSTDSGATTVGFGKTLLKVAVDTKCRTELNNNSIWNAAKIVLSSAQQEQIQSNVCTCVSDYAVDNVSVNQLAAAAIDETTRAQLIGNLVTDSLTQCYSQALKSKFS